MLPTQDRTQVLNSSTGAERTSNLVVVKDTIFYVYERYGSLYLANYENNDTYFLAADVLKFSLTNASNPDKTINENKLWIWYIASDGTVNIVEYEPFIDTFPTLTNYTELTYDSKALSVYSNILANKPIQVITLLEEPRQLEIRTYADPFTDTYLSVDHQNWSDTNSDDFSLSKDVRDTFSITYSDTTDPTNIYVGYSIDKYTVVFVDHDGSLIDDQEVEYGKGAATPTPPSRDGYDFTGWDVVYDAITQDTVITALYEIQTFLVRYLDWDDAILHQETVDWSSDSNWTGIPTRDGHLFTSWDTETTNITAAVDTKAIYIEVHEVNALPIEISYEPIATSIEVLSAEIEVNVSIDDFEFTAFPTTVEYINEIVIKRQPTSMTGERKELIKTYVIATGGKGELSYQWFRNGRALEGACKEGFEFWGTKLGKANYFVRITDEEGNFVDSNIVVLTVVEQNRMNPQPSGGYKYTGGGTRPPGAMLIKNVEIKKRP